MKKANGLLVLLTVALSFYSLSIGVVAFFAPSIFYQLFAEYTGAFNQHFLRDIGAAFLTAGGMLGLAVAIAKWRAPLVLAGATFLTLHGLIHLQELLTGVTPSEHIAADFIEVLLPASLMVLVAIISLQSIDVSATVTPTTVKK